MMLVLFEDSGDGLEAAVVIEAVVEDMIDEYCYMMVILDLAAPGLVAMGLYDFDVTAQVFDAPALIGVDHVLSPWLGVFGDH